MEYLNVPLKDGTTFGEYLAESVSYRQELYDDFAQEVLFTPMDEDDLKRYAESNSGRTSPRQRFIHE